METTLDKKKDVEYSIKFYLDSIGPIKTLTATEERKLLSKYKSGDINALHELVIKNQYIIIKEAIKFIGKGVELLDLIQDANLACILAIKNYTFEKGGFKNYLHLNIYRNLENITPGYYSLVRYPHNVINKLNRIFDNLDNNFANLSLIKNEIEYDRKYFKYSLLNYISINDFNREFRSISDRVDLDLDSLIKPTYKTLDYKFIFRSLNQELKNVLKTLDDVEQKVINWHYGLFGERSLTFEEIGQKLNLTRERIRQIQKRALGRLKHRYRSEHLRSYLTLYYPDPEFITNEEESLIHFGINMADEKYAINLLKKFVKLRRRKTLYPNIPNIAEACRKFIIEILKQYGEPCSYNRIKERVYGKYPLLKNGTLIYALSTAEDVINIKKGLYALKQWIFTEDISKRDSEKFSKEKIKNNVIFETKLELNELSLKTVEFNENQLNLINYFLENKGQLSKLKITVFARSNHYNLNQLINSINKQFIEKYNEPLINEENSNYFLNNIFIT